MAKVLVMFATILHRNFFESNNTVIGTNLHTCSFY